MELFCDLVQSRVTLIAESKTCPTDLKEAVSSLLYAAPRCDIPELMVIRDQLTKKFGKEFVSAASENRDFAVNQRILIKLSVKIPEPYLCVHYLKDIAEENGIELDESLHQPVGPEVPTSAFSGSGGSGGSGGANGGANGGGVGGMMMDPLGPMINVNGAYDLQPSLHMDHQAMSNQLFHQQQQQQPSHMQQHQQFPQQPMQPPMQHQMGVMYPSPSHLDPYGLSSSSSTNMNNMNSMKNMNNVNNSNNSNRLSGSMQPLSQQQLQQQQQQPQPQQQIPPLNQLTQSGYNVDFTPGHLIGPQSTMPKLSDYQPQQHQQQQFPSMNNVHGMDDDGFIQSSSESQPAPSYDFDDLQKRFEALKRREL